jgi:bacteriocin biosynthesis docking scaffold, sagD family
VNTYKKLLRCISADYGIIDHMMRIPGMSGDPRLVGYGVQSVNMRAMIGGDYTPLGAGCGLKREEAFKASVGETVERYCSAFVNSEECVSGAYSSLNGRYRLVMPSEFSLFHEKQFKDDFFSSVIHPFSSEVELTWTKVYSLTKGSYQYLPAQCVYLPFLRDRKLITMGVSTGLSAHSSFYQAILNGLYEAVERDAVAIAWLQGLSQRKVIIPSWLRRYIDDLYPTGYDWHLFNITTDIEIPTIFGFCIGRAEYGDFIAVGAATRSTYASALRKTVREIGQSMLNFRYLLAQRKGSGAGCDDYRRLNSFDDHSYFYLVSPAAKAILNDWITREETWAIGEDCEEWFTHTKREIRWALKKVSSCGCEMFVKDLTTVDARQLGLFVVKMFSPQLVPLSGDYRFYFKGGHRLYDVPGKLGYSSRGYDELIQFPHPFP